MENEVSTHGQKHGEMVFNSFNYPDKIIELLHSSGSCN